jgi:hypothetical protein
VRPAERLRRRRCLGLRVAVVLGVFLAVVNRGDTTLVVVALVLIGLVLVAFWRDCRPTRHER